MATTASNGALKREKVTPSSHPHTINKNQQGEENSGKLEEIINNNANPEEGIADEDEVEADDQVKVEENEVSPEEPVGEEKEEEGVKQSCLDVREILKGVVGRDDDQLIRESGK
ncbi:hypothetical protein OIU85_017694 [Salix viminalis]|uniref:Uncharacterized protein n=1 Tax=Salix viminalis TaxID=40686 RepID=A0A9Q0V7Z7_SALVM|nr:hypothetical protein OIU85_017694 [Salix viminalis]